MLDAEKTQNGNEFLVQLWKVHKQELTFTKTKLLFSRKRNGKNL